MAVMSAKLTRRSMLGLILSSSSAALSATFPASFCDAGERRKTDGSQRADGWRYWRAGHPHLDEVTTRMFKDPQFA